MSFRLSGSLLSGALNDLPARSCAICRTTDRSNGTGCARADVRSPGAAIDTSGKAEAARKCLRFTKWPTVTDGDHKRHSAALTVPACGTLFPVFPFVQTLGPAGGLFGSPRRPTDTFRGGITDQDAMHISVRLVTAVVLRSLRMLDT